MRAGTVMFKRFLFPVALAAPLLFLLTVVVVTAYDLHRLRAVVPDAVYRDLQAHLESKRPVSKPLPDAIRADGGGKARVFLFGESSLLLSDGTIFPEELARLRGDLDVVNLGVSGIDSLSVRQRVADALAAARPDVIVLYYGHNDYNNAYQGFLVPRFYRQFRLLLRLAFVFRDRTQPRDVLMADTWYWYSRLMRPRIFQAFQSVGLVDLDRAGGFAAINDLILTAYRRNNEAILSLAAAQRIPVVLMTPVGNLQAEPFGDVDSTTYWYRKAKAAAGYRETIGFMKAARDAETLTYDLRAKSPLLEYVRACARPGVYVLDLERLLEEARFGFGYDDFLDYFHFNDRTHRLVAALLADFLVRHGLAERGRR